MIQHSAGVRTQHHELATKFERIRSMLLTDRFEARLQNPLSYWAVPADRRLPRALMHRTLGDLLRTSFGSLAATPGIGHKKMQSLMQLLDRALHTDELERERLDQAIQETVHNLTGAEAVPPSVHGDPTNISEVTWAKWRDVVMQHGLGDQPLGRFVDSLHDLPRVIWSTPLSTYAGLTLEQIRRLKTHGEKRVRAVVTIFGRLHDHLLEAGAGCPVGSAGLKAITPEAVDTLDAWLVEVTNRGALPTYAELRTRFVLPLVEQIRRDAGAATAELVLGRLAWEGQKLSVRRAAMKLRLTRARIYQLLEDAETVVAVRWPKGLAHMRTLMSLASKSGSDSPERTLLTLTAETLFAAEYKPEVVPPPAFLRRIDTLPVWMPTSQASFAQR